MRTLVVILGFVCLSLVLAARVHADEQQDAARMEQIIAEVQKVASSGWTVDFKLVDRENHGRPGSYPAIAIMSKTPLRVENIGPNTSPDRSQEISNKTVEIWLCVLPSMTVKEYADARAKNEVIDRKRIDFLQRTNMRRGPSSSYMGGNPIPPDAFKPRNDDETRLVRQYAMLWAAAEPRRLPTHHIDLLTFELFEADWLKILDDAKAEEYQKILATLKKPLVAFE